mmetsp:Transcript_7703/g.7275  ORF Transcript_7703/g.7275 Transcript_7703/m.7275 type:complete len:109 (-) Transcript_7703:250-576(-)|eukprot:CAMPEP_0197743748 /NCGR_PEP_ID=MMETSP1435-20131217/36124_1 /TAXON_ID=426625 /ORGANISM="Chaetoceros brevis, Strain CCMP164" /LENGTH=108 /DNA_ID=CAMNT_0043334817 /DNA_START=72 /DNA_END=398 /DNA_ORIENTATION=-
MTDMYDPPKTTQVQLPAYKHSERGSERGRAQDPVQYILAAEQRARERQIAYETVRLLRQDVIECYRKEGVNHYDNCVAVNKRYYDVVVKNDVGQVQPPWANPAKNVGF